MVLAVHVYGDFADLVPANLFIQQAKDHQPHHFKRNVEVLCFSAAPNITNRYQGIANTIVQLFVL
jgi:hypothetical protein